MRKHVCKVARADLRFKDGKGHFYKKKRQFLTCLLPRKVSILKFRLDFLDFSLQSMDALRI